MSRGDGEGDSPGRQQHEHRRQDELDRTGAALSDLELDGNQARAHHREPGGAPHVGVAAAEGREHDRGSQNEAGCDGRFHAQLASAVLYRYSPTCPRGQLKPPHKAVSADRGAADGSVIAHVKHYRVHEHAT